MLADIIVRYGYVIVFAAAAVEGDATLLTGTFLAHRGYLRLDLVMLTAGTATVVMNQVYFWLARGYGQARVAAMEQQRGFHRVITWMTRYGLPLVIGSRFIYGFRIAIPIACGGTGMSPLRFTVADLAGATVWTLVLGTAGFAIGQLLELLFDDLRAHEWSIAGVLFLGIVILLAKYWPDIWGLRAAPTGQSAPDETSSR